MGQRKRFRAAQRADAPANDAAPDTLEPLATAGPDKTGASASELSGERRQLTVVFVDLVGSTDLSRRLDPEDMSDLLHRYQDVVSGTVARLGGHVEGFLGDGVVVFFGWPLAREDSVQQAVQAGLAVVSQIAALKTPQNETLACRVGIATGLVVVLPDGQVVGETPNLAARLQSIGTPGSVVVSDTTANLTKGMFSFEMIERLSLKGFPENMRAHFVGDARLGVTRFEARERHALVPLVGRETELTTLLCLWDAARDGSGAVVRIEGEAGIGKSRLLAALKEATPSKDRFIFNYQCAQNFSEVPLWPVAESMRQTYALLGPATPEQHRTRLTERLRGIGNTMDAAPALMASLIGVDIGPNPEVDALDARSRRSRTLEMLISQVKLISAIRPVQIVLEDAHWADPTTLEYISRLLDEVANLPVLVLMTTRGTDPLQGSERCFQMTLERLAAADSRALIAAMLEERTSVENASVTGEMIDALTARGEGIPLFVEELTRSVFLESPTGVDSIDVPATLHDLLMARLDRLGSAKAVAQSASCLGREFSVDLLCEVLDQAPANLADPLRQLTEAGILMPGRVHSGADFAFYHALIRDAAYESLLFKDRQALHRKILGILDTRANVRPELLAQHAEAAGDLMRAGRSWLDASQRAAARWANKEAERLTSRALDTIAQWPPSEDRTLVEIDTRLTRGDAIGALFGYAAQEVVENYAATAVLAEETGQMELLFQAIRGHWNGVYNSGDFTQSLPLAERMYAIAQDTGDPQHWVVAQRSMGSNYLSLNRFTAASEAYRDCIARGKDLLDGGATNYGELPVAVSHGMLSQLDSFAGRHDTALKNILKAEEIARQNGHPLAINQALAIVGIIRWLRGEIDLSLAAAQEEARLAETYDYVHWKAHSDIMIGACECRLAGSDRGLSQLVQGIDAWIGTGARSYAPVFFTYLAECALTAGRREMARKALADGLRLARASGEFFALAELQRLHARMARPSIQAELYARALDTARRQGARQYHLRTLCDAIEHSVHYHPEALAGLHAELSTLLSLLSEHRKNPDQRRARALLERIAA